MLVNKVDGYFTEEGVLDWDANEDSYALLSNIRQALEPSDESGRHRARRLAGTLKGLGFQPDEIIGALVEISQHREAERLPFPDRLAMMEEAVDIVAEELGPYHPAVVPALERLAPVLFVRDGYDKAEPLFRRMIEITEKAGGPHSPELPYYLGLWAKALYVERQYDEAEALLGRAVWIMDKQAAPSEPQLIEILDVYAPVLRKAGQTLEADAMQARADALADRNRDVQRFTDSTAKSYRRESIMYALLNAGDFLLRLILVPLVIIVLGFLFLRECG